MDRLQKLPQLTREMFLIALVSIACHFVLKYLHPVVYTLSVPVILGVYIMLWRGMMIQMEDVWEQADIRSEQASKLVEESREMYADRCDALIRVVNALRKLHVIDARSPMAVKLFAQAWLHKNMSETYTRESIDGKPVTAEMILDSVSSDIEKAMKFAKSAESGVTLISEGSDEKPKPSAPNAEPERDPGTLGRPMNPEDV